jgi:electron transfer flavoprotein alpha subunit
MMIRRGVLIVSAATLTLGLARAEEPQSPSSGNAVRVLKHVVMYKFKDDQSKERVQEVVDAFSALPQKIDAIIGYEHGPNVSQEGKSDGLTHVFVVTFRDEAGRDAYLKHPAHDAYVEVVKDRREKVVVFDYWADAPETDK